MPDASGGPRRGEHPVIWDCASPDFDRSRTWRIFVDGREINEVFYLDTDAGFVRTYDVLGTGDVIGAPAYDGYGKPIDPDPSWEGGGTGVYWKTIHGVVTMEETFPPKEDE